MSAYVVEDETINRILSVIAQDANKYPRYGWSQFSDPLAHIGHNIATPGGIARLGAVMLNLNIIAVRERYGDHGPISNLPGKVGHGEFSYDGTVRPDPVQALESLSCWLYQCSEGDLPETPLYKVFDHDIRIAIMEQIIAAFAPAPKVKWG